LVAGSNHFRRTSAVLRTVRTNEASN